MIISQGAAPYGRLSGFYLFYFGALGALVPYWGLYLQSQGFAPRQIGELMAVLMATKVVAPNVWGWISDHTGLRMAIVRLASLLAAVSFLGVFVARGYWWLGTVMMLFSFFWNAALPQMEATTLNHLGTNVHRYSLVRLWGSIGFIVVVATLGPLLDERGAGLLPPVLLGLYAGIWLSSMTVPDAPQQGHRPAHGTLVGLLLRPEVVAFLAVCLLMQASHGPYYTFYSIYLEERGYSRAIIGQLWALGVVAEIGVFLAMGRWLALYGARRLLLVSLAAAAVRWVLIGVFVDHLAVLVFAQVLHAATFGAYHAAAIHLVHHYFTGRHQVRGQAIYSSLGFGAGGALGSLYSGYLWSAVGPGVTFFTAAALSAAALLVAATRMGR